MTLDSFLVVFKANHKLLASPSVCAVDWQEVVPGRVVLLDAARCVEKEEDI